MAITKTRLLLPAPVGASSIARGIAIASGVAMAVIIGSADSVGDALAAGLATRPPSAAAV
jgi:hypothetical protein